MALAEVYQAAEKTLFGKLTSGPECLFVVGWATLVILYTVYCTLRATIDPWGGVS